MKRGTALRYLQRDGEADDVAVKAHRAVQVGDRQMDLKQSAHTHLAVKGSRGRASLKLPPSAQLDIDRKRRAGS